MLNLFKIPFSVALGLITPQSLTLNLWGLPLIILGGLLGYKFLAMINIAIFKWLIRAAVLTAAVRLVVF